MLKKTLTLAVILLNLLQGARPVVAQTTSQTDVAQVGDQTVNSENVARVFLKSKIAYYKCYFSDSLRGGEVDWEYGEFTMQADGTITVLSLQGDNVAIPSDAPLRGLPYPTVGQRRDFNLSINAYDKDNQYLGYGNAYTVVLKKGDPLVVELKMANVGDFIKSALPAGVSPNGFVLETTDGSRFYYNTGYGGFFVWSSPVTGVGFRIYDSQTGIVYQYGDIVPFDDVQVTTDSIVSVTIEGNVVPLSFGSGNNYTYRSNQLLNGSVPVVNPSTGVKTNAKAKVYTASLNGKMVSMSIYGVKGKVVVKEWSDSGDLQVIAQGQSYIPEYDSFSLTRVTIPGGCDKVIIEVIGDLDVPTIGFELSISAYGDPFHG